MSNKLFLDSSILVEWAKKTKPSLFNNLAGQTNYTLCISQIVLSEFVYYWLAIGGGKAPVTLKQDGAIPAVFQAHNPLDLLAQMTWLDAGPDIIPLHLRLMQQYNLLPNDALILATCILNNVTQVASFDADFAPACAGEGIRLIRSVDDL
ncbi:MAG: PIN domain-containing protein [Spirosoma sp.]|nr:PIN domain-containing protein [Spirosoma sp.]